VKFLVDAQLPPALAQWLRDAGHDAQHVDELGLRNADDAVLWQHALDSRAAVITKDIDFAVAAQQAAAGPVIVWLRIGNATNQALRLWIEPRLAGVLQLLNEGHRLVEVR